jgi:hypothetical protein
MPLLSLPGRRKRAQLRVISGTFDRTCTTQHYDIWKIPVHSSTKNSEAVLTASCVDFILSNAALCSGQQIEMSRNDYNDCVDTRLQESTNHRTFMMDCPLLCWTSAGLPHALSTLLSIRILSIVAIVREGDLGIVAFRL